MFHASGLVNFFFFVCLVPTRPCLSTLAAFPPVPRVDGQLLFALDFLPDFYKVYNFLGSSRAPASVRSLSLFLGLPDAPFWHERLENSPTLYTTNETVPRASRAFRQGRLVRGRFVMHLGVTV